MKKILTIFASIFLISLYSNAQSGSNSCRIEGGGYIQADYYEDGRLVISNQSEQKTTSVKVNVTCTITYWDYEKYMAEETDYSGFTREVEKKKKVKKQKDVTIFNGTLYDFEKYSSTEIPNSRNSVKIKAKKDFQMSEAIKYDYTVIVGNPMCK